MFARRRRSADRLLFVDEHDRSTEVFFDVQRGLPRQGIGSDEQTLRALALCFELPDQPDVLDVGCGPGKQTVALARASGGVVTAVDLHEEFLGELRERAESAGLLERICVIQADMRDLPFEPESFDLIWSEGAAYNMGVREALADWRRFLRPGGYVAFSELVWCTAHPPQELFDFFTAEYAGMTDVAGNLARVRATGYELVGHFTLTESAWWDEYLSPLESKLPALLAKYAGDETALKVVESTHREIDMRRRYTDEYAYEFFVARKAGLQSA